MEELTPLWQLLVVKEQGYDVIGVTMQIWQDEPELIQEKTGMLRPFCR